MMLNLGRIEKVKCHGHFWYFLDPGVIVSMNFIRKIYTAERGKVLFSTFKVVKVRVIVFERIWSADDSAMLR
jgi:hypothetical protein